MENLLSSIIRVITEYHDLIQLAIALLTALIERQSPRNEFDPRKQQNPCKKSSSKAARSRRR